MSNTRRAPVASDASAATAPNRKVLAIVLGVIAVAALIGSVIAFRSSDSEIVQGNGIIEVPDDALQTAAVAASGNALPTHAADGIDVNDPAIGIVAPELAGQAPNGDPTNVQAGEPTLLVFLAHWCPHCRAEVPRIVAATKDGKFDGVRVVAVLTGTDPAAPNYPPAEWLAGEEWTAEALLDSPDGTAAAAFGLSSYPYLVMLDSEGKVAARGSGELPVDDIVDMTEQALNG
jgi:cytochrome c biogenesis protein CcmG, thiol:disulfide interchange protein DsbE